MDHAVEDVSMVLLDDGVGGYEADFVDLVLFLDCIVDLILGKVVYGSGKSVFDCVRIVD